MDCSTRSSCWRISSSDPGISPMAASSRWGAGVTLIYGILRFANFAHGDIMAFGTGHVILVTWWLQGLGHRARDPAHGAAGAARRHRWAPSLYLLAADRWSIASTESSEGQADDLVMASVGRDVRHQRHHPPDHRPGRPALRGWRALHHLGARVPRLDRAGRGLALRSAQALTIVVGCCRHGGLLFWFLNRTRTGKSMRAYSDNEDLALLSGINPDARGHGHLDRSPAR
jgi:branched-chain amino acid transport system permease protein